MVRNLNDQIPTERHVRSCQMVIVERDQEPSEVMPVGPEVLRALIRQTTIPGTLPTDVPSCARQLQPAPVPAEQFIPPDFIPDVIEGIPGDPGIGIFVPIPPGNGDPGDTSWTGPSWTDTSYTDPAGRIRVTTDTSWTLRFTLNSTPTDTVHGYVASRTQVYTDTSWTDTSYTDTSWTDTSRTDTSYTDT